MPLPFLLSQKNWPIQKAQIVQIGAVFNLTKLLQNYIQNPSIAMLNFQNSIPNLGTK